MTNLTRLEQLLERATKGEMALDGMYYLHIHGEVVGEIFHSEKAKEDGELLAALFNAAPDLLAVVKAAKELRVCISEKKTSYVEVAYWSDKLDAALLPFTTEHQDQK